MALTERERLYLENMVEQIAAAEAADRAKIEDVDVLRAVHNGIRAVSTLDALRRIYQQNGDNDDGSQDPTDSHEPSIRAESASTGR